MARLRTSANARAMTTGLGSGLAVISGWNTTGLQLGWFGVDADEAGSREGAAYEYSPLHILALLEKEL
jgi:hypothetical protein